MYNIEPALKCKGCGKVKLTSEFYKTGTGWTGKCKECICKRVRENRKEKVDYYRNYDQLRNQKRKEYIKSKNKKYAKENPDKINKHQKKYQESNKLKRAAHVIFNNALRDGKVKKGLCQVCKSKEVEAHHFDYTKPLDVIWLCKEHHEKIHWWLRWNKRNSTSSNLSNS